MADAGPPPPPLTDGGMVTMVQGHITASTTWSGTVYVTGQTVIDAGVTVTVMPGTVISVVSTAAIPVLGTFDLEGTSAAPIKIMPSNGAPHYLGISVQMTGQLITHYANVIGAGVTTSGTATATLIDSRFSNASHDLIVMSGGTVDIEYSALGVEPPTTDTTHCDMHFGGGASSGNKIKVTHSNVSTSSYGLMFYSGNTADFTYNNWFQNGADVATNVANPVSGDFSFGWFAKNKAPTGTGITAQNLATARLTDAGPRP
jgi:hypothetical protein